MSTALEHNKINIHPEIFRAYDIRGIVGEQLNETILEQIGLALGTQAQAENCNSIVIGRDGRLSGPSLFAALTRGLLQTGINVIDIGCVPTPVLYYATYHYNTKCGAMLTGSHNPGNYNGVKMMIAGKTISDDAVQKLYTRIKTQDFIYNTGAHQQNFIKEEYIKEVTKHIKLRKVLKVVIDCGNGVAGVIAADLFKALDCEVDVLFENVDGNFPNHHPDPGNLDNLSALINRVKETNADVGLAFDGDADRLGVVTNAGNVIMPDRQMMLFARNILKNYPKAHIVYDVKCSNHLETFIKNHSGNPCMWKTGHSYIKNKMRDTGALLAGEMSGHIFFKERWFGFDDALYAGARLLEILANDYPNKTLELLACELPDSVNTPEINVKIADSKKHAFVEKLIQNNKFNNTKNIITMDGIRVEYSDGWGLVRASNTTPALVLRFEADNKKRLEQIIIEFKQNISDLDPGLELDF